MNLAGILAQRSIMTAAVAAAASVPSSLTSTKALCTTLDSTRSLAGDMPVTKQSKITYLIYVEYGGDGNYADLRELQQSVHVLGSCFIVRHVPRIHHTREVTLLHVEGVHHAHADQDSLHVVILL